VDLIRAARDFEPEHALTLRHPFFLTWRLSGALSRRPIATPKCAVIGPFFFFYFFYEGPLPFGSNRRRCLPPPCGHLAVCQLFFIVVLSTAWCSVPSNGSFRQWSGLLNVFDRIFLVCLFLWSRLTCLLGCLLRTLAMIFCLSDFLARFFFDLSGVRRSYDLPLPSPCKEAWSTFCGGSYPSFSLLSCPFSRRTTNKSTLSAGFVGWNLFLPCLYRSCFFSSFSILVAPLEVPPPHIVFLVPPFHTVFCH